MNKQGNWWLHALVHYDHQGEVLLMHRVTGEISLARGTPKVRALLPVGCKCAGGVVHILSLPGSQSFLPPSWVAIDSFGQLPVFPVVGTSTEISTPSSTTHAHCVAPGTWLNQQL
jgi:hypothetical protein